MTRPDLNGFSLNDKFPILYDNSKYQALKLINGQELSKLN